MQELLPFYSSDAMIAAAPEGTPPRRICVSKFKTTPCPAVPHRGPEAGVYRMLKIFMVRL